MFAANRTPTFSSLDNEDKLADIKIAMLLAVDGFEKTNATAGNFEEYVETPEFGAYFKSCIWYKRSAITKSIYKKRTVDGDVISLSALSEDFLEDKSLAQSSQDKWGNRSKLFEIELEDDISKLVTEILSDAEYFKLNGKFNVSKIARNTNMPISKITKLLKRLKSSLAQQLDTEEW